MIQIKAREVWKFDPLLVFALKSEIADEFATHHKLITGIGKVNAAYHLAKAIKEQKPRMIINVGSAGSNTFKRKEVVCCTRFIQRDMDVTGLGFRRFETPFSGLEPVLSYGLKLEGIPEGTCGSGDSFETAHEGMDYDVIDMEAYALAWVAMKEQIPFLCLKYITDGADDNAAADWNEQVHQAAVAFKKVLEK